MMCHNWVDIGIHCNCCESKLTTAATNLSEPQSNSEWATDTQKTDFCEEFCCLGWGEDLCTTVRDERWWRELQCSILSERFSELSTADAVGRETKELPSGLCYRVASSLCLSFLCCHTSSIIQFRLKRHCSVPPFRTLGLGLAFSRWNKWP